MTSKRHQSKSASESLPKSLQDSIDIKDLSCVVCKDMHVAKMYQCKNGHLICHTCYYKISESENALCPICRKKLSRDDPCHSRLAESVIGKLVVKCPKKDCSKVLRNEDLRTHTRDLCLYRAVRCKFGLIGCEWKGIAKRRRKHEKNCPFLRRDANSILARCLERSREREAHELRKKQKTKSDRKVLAALSSRCRDIQVRDIVLYPVNGRTDNALSSKKFRVFNEKLVLTVSKRKGQKPPVKTIRRSGERNSVSTAQKELVFGAKRKPMEGQGPEETEKVSLSLSCPYRSEKTRLEGFLLPGPDLDFDFRPVPFKLTLGKNEQNKAAMTLSLTKENAREFLSCESANMRLIVIHKDNGKSKNFTGDSFERTSESDREDLECDIFNDDCEDIDDYEEFYGNEFDEFDEYNTAAIRSP